MLFVAAISITAPAVAQIQPADDTERIEQQPPAGRTARSTDDRELMRPTELGLRFTPQMARAMSRKFVEQMTRRYELDEKQGKEIESIMVRQFMGFAHENEQAGRDMIELMMATMIENDGRMSKDAAMEFARLSGPFTENLKKLFTRGAAEIGQQMSVGQRLKFTADATAAAAGVTLFESRMKRWSEGKVSDGANPFFDARDNERESEDAEPEPEDPGEPKERREARRTIEQRIDRQINPERSWEYYLAGATRYYELNEKQVTAARSILKDCQERAKAIKSKAWREQIMENRINQRLTQVNSDGLADGPWMFSIEEEFHRLMHPLEELTREFKRRIDALPDSTQRAAARESVRRKLQDKGLKHVPS